VEQGPNREVRMMFTLLESNLIICIAVETGLLISSFISTRSDWEKNKRLRAEKEALKEILLTFLRGQIETLPSKANEDAGKECK